MTDKKMAPTCTRCGHKASEHHKQMRMRTYCVKEFYDPEEPGVVDGVCACTIYRPKET